MFDDSVLFSNGLFPTFCGGIGGCGSSFRRWASAVVGLTLLAVFLLSPAGVAWAEVYQFVDEEGTLVVTNRPGDLPSDRPVRLLVGRRPRPTGQPPVPAHPATITVIARPETVFRDEPGPDGVRFTYYDVCAPTAAAALARTLRKGPYDPREGRRFPAQTRWSLGWGYEYSVPSPERRPGGGVDVQAEVYDVAVYADVEVVLPRLEPDCPMTGPERRRWERAMAALRRHEMDHVDLVLNEDALKGLADSIAGLRRYRFAYDGGVEAGVRRNLQRDTHADGVPWVRWIRDINRHYDAVTDHGLKPEKRGDFFRSLASGGVP